MNWPAVDPTTMDPADLPAVQRARSELGDGRAVGVVSAGNPAGELIEASQTASMVVMGTRGRGALAAGLLGSTAYAVAAHSACPLVVVRGPKDSTSVPSRALTGRSSSASKTWRHPATNCESQRILLPRPMRR